MSGMAGNLPDYQSSTPGQLSHHDQQRFLAGTPGGASTYQTHHFPGQSPMNTPNYPGHSSQYASTYQQRFQVQPSSQSHSGGPSPIHPSYPGGAYFPAQQQQYMYYPGHYAQTIQAHHGSFPSTYGPGPYPQQGADLSMMGGRPSHSGFSSGALSPNAYGSGGAYLRPGSMPGKSISCLRGVVS